MQNGKKSKLGSILLGIGAVCVVLRLVTKGPGWTLGAVVFLLVGAIVDGASRKRYQREVRGPLVQEAVEAVFPGASYTPDSGIGYTDAREAAIEIAGGYDLVTSRDGIGGTYNGLPFQLSTVWLGLRDWFRDEETGMEREQEKEVFHGPWLLLRTAPLGGTVRLRTRTGLGKAGRLAGRKTGNAEFDQTFVLASDSDEEMQRVLSASMCERLLAVQQCIGKGWICLLSDGRVSVVADTGSGLFDGTGQRRGSAAEGIYRGLDAGPARDGRLAAPGRAVIHGIETQGGQFVRPYMNSMKNCIAARFYMDFTKLLFWI